MLYNTRSLRNIELKHANVYVGGQGTNRNKQQWYHFGPPVRDKAMRVGFAFDCVENLRVQMYYEMTCSFEYCFSYSKKAAIKKYSCNKLLLLECILLHTP